MNKRAYSILVTSIVSVMLPLSSAQSMECGPVKTTTVSTKAGKIRLQASTTGQHPTIFYRTDLDVNTDGASRSYHPQDPRGNTMALNNMGNAITVAWNASGRKITCDHGDAANRRGACFDEYIEAFEGARDQGFDPQKYPRIETSGIIPWKDDAAAEHRVPCLNASGYFVSQTSLSLKQSDDACDQGQYVDSLKINAVVYMPGKLKAQGVVSDKGDLVVLRDRASGRYAFALHGDSNGVRMGEGSVALAAELSGKTLPADATKSDIYGLKRGDVDYLVFAKDDVERHWRNLGGTTQARIDEFGKEIFDAWGGKERFEACAAVYGR